MEVSNTTARAMKVGELVGTWQKFAALDSHNKRPAENNGGGQVYHSHCDHFRSAGVNLRHKRRQGNVAGCKKYEAFVLSLCLLHFTLAVSWHETARQLLRRRKLT